MMWAIVKRVNAAAGFSNALGDHAVSFLEKFFCDASVRHARLARHNDDLEPASIQQPE